MASVMQLQSCSTRVCVRARMSGVEAASTRTLQTLPFPADFVGLRRQQHSKVKLLRWQSRQSSEQEQGRRAFTVRAADATFGADAGGGPAPVFPRINVRDPYKRLGIDPEATSEELQEARNYLIKQYETHEKSREAIEWAYDKIIAMRLKSRKKRGMNLKAGLQKKEDPLIPTPQFVKDFQKSIKTPATDVIFKRLALYAGFAAWSVLQSAEQGPAFQLFIAFATTVYYLREKTQKWARSIGLSLGSLMLGWFAGSVIPVALSAYIPPTLTSELIAAEFAFLFMWGAVTWLN